MADGQRMTWAMDLPSESYTGDRTTSMPELGCSWASRRMTLWAEAKPKTLRIDRDRRRSLC